MSSEKIYVLHVTMRWGQGIGGVKRFIHNAFEALPEDLFRQAIFSVGPITGDCQGLPLLGCSASGKSVSKSKLLKKVRNVFATEAPDVVHIHGNNGLALLYAEQARRAGCNVRVVHSHNSALGSGGFGKRFADAVLKKRYMEAPTTRVACSAAAGDWLFGTKPYRIVRNGINVERFVFSEADRGAVRSALGISEDGFVFALVGAGIPVKNASFALAVLSDIRRKGCEAHLVLVGEGPEAEMLQGEAERMGVMPYAHFVGTVGDVWRYYSASDALLMPSFYEGLPITLIEAQANGLPCLVSETVSSEADVAGLVEYLPLGDAAEWEAASMKAAESGSARGMGESLIASEAVRASGFSLADLGGQLVDLYEGGTL